MDKIIALWTGWLLSLLGGCGGHSHTTGVNTECERYLNDKMSIAQSFLDNTESSRIGMLYEAGESIPDHKKDMIDFPYSFASWAIRLGEDYRKQIVSPREMSTQITPMVDTIFYSRDSLLCIALIIVSEHYDQIAGIIDEEVGFTGMGVVGQRDSINQRFRIFPMEGVLDSWPDYESLSKDLQKFYTKEATIDDTKYGANDPRIFESAHRFKKNSDGEYYFEYDHGEKKDFYSNTPQYLNRKINYLSKD